MQSLCGAVAQALIQHSDHTSVFFPELQDHPWRVPRTFDIPSQFLSKSIAGEEISSISPLLLMQMAQVFHQVRLAGRPTSSGLAKHQVRMNQPSPGLWSQDD